MPLFIPSHVAQLAYDKINALRDVITALPECPEKAEALAKEAELHQFADRTFRAMGGVYINRDDHHAAATTNAPAVILLSGGTDK